MGNSEIIHRNKNTHKNNISRHNKKRNSLLTPTNLHTKISSRSKNINKKNNKFHITTTRHTFTLGELTSRTTRKTWVKDPTASEKKKDIEKIKEWAKNWTEQILKKHETPSKRKEQNKKTI